MADAPVPRTARPGRIMAHRGASQVAPENTLAAFRIARAQGADWFEFDVSLLGDGTPVVHHDATLERCTSGTGPLTGIGQSDLARIDAGGWFDPAFTGEPLPTLDAALNLIAGLGFSANLEMKPQGAPPGPLAEQVAMALAARPWAAERIVVSSFDFEALVALRGLAPGQPLAMLWEAPPPDWPAWLRRIGAEALHIWWKDLTLDLLDEALAEDTRLRVYTANDPVAMAPFRRPGLTSVITDHPPLYFDDPDWAAWAAAL